METIWGKKLSKKRIYNTSNRVFSLYVDTNVSFIDWDNITWWLFLFLFLFIFFHLFNNGVWHRFEEKNSAFQFITFLSSLAFGNLEVTYLCGRRNRSLVLLPAETTFLVKMKVVKFFIQYKNYMLKNKYYQLPLKLQK